LYNTSFKQICNLVHRFEEDGINGLKNKPNPDKPPRLNKKQKNELKLSLKIRSQKILNIILVHGMFQL